MTRTYANFDRANLIDNRSARDALVNAGIESVEFDQAEIDRIRDVLSVSNRRLGEDGQFSIELYEEMLEHISAYRDRAEASTAQATEPAGTEP